MVNKKIIQKLENLKQYKYLDSHSREVIPLWRLEHLLDCLSSGRKE